MRTILTGISVVAIGASLAACDRTAPVAANDTAANVVVESTPVANDVTDMNTVNDTSADMNNVTEQGSTDH
jgi:hypothetical protein